MSKYFEKKLCPVCENDFVARSPVTKYCSYECKGKVNYACYKRLLKRRNDAAFEDGRRLGAIEAYESLLKLDIANCMVNDWLKAQIKLKKELKP